MTFDELVAEYATYELDAALDQAERQDYLSHGQALRRAGAAAEGQPARAALLNLLAAVMTVAIKESDPAFSFYPLYLSEERYCPLNELTDEEVLQLRAAAHCIQEMGARARILDALWHSRRRHADCRDAVTAYLDSADADTDESVPLADRYARALGLSRSLGAKESLYKQALRRVIARAEVSDASGGKPFFLMRLIRTVERHAGSKALPFADTALARAEAALQQKEHEEAEHWLRLAISLFQVADQQVRLRAAEQRLGDCLSYISDDMAAAPQPHFLSASMWMHMAIEAYQRARVPREALRQARFKLADLQQASFEDLQPIPLPQPLLEQLQQAYQAREDSLCADVTGKSLQAALITLAGRPSFPSFAKVRSEVAQEMRNAPFRTIARSVFLDNRGRPKTVEGGFHASAEKNEEEIMANCFRHAQRWCWLPRSGMIVAALTVIREEHHATFDDLRSLVRSNPWIADGHEEIILRGLAAGIHGEWLLASHLLVPQFEACVRSLLRNAGVEISNIGEGVEEDKTFGGLLLRPELTQILGEDRIFEFRGILTEKSGMNFRNELAHGLLRTQDYYTDAAVNAWWAMLRTCCEFNGGPLNERRRGALHDDGPQSEPTNL